MGSELAWILASVAVCGSALVAYRSRRLVSASRELQETLAKSEARLRAVADAFANAQRIAHMGSWDLDLDKGEVVWSDEVFRIYGWPIRTGPIPISEPRSTNLPEDDVLVSLAFEETLKTGKPLEVQHRIRRPDGSIRRVRCRAELVRDGEGRPRRIVGTALDTTDAMLAEQKIREAEAAVRSSQEQLLQSQKLEAIGQLAAGIAHDFNNLLVVIKSCAGFLRDALPAGDDRRADAEEIWRAGERAAHLTRQLLAFARRSVANPVPVDVSAVVRGMEKLLHRTIGEDVTLSVALEEAAWKARIDPGHLEQVLLNLAVNARDAMPGGGQLRIETRNVALHPAPGQDGPSGRCVVLSVADTGCGIPADVLPKVFEPFFTTKERGKGTGLGLSTVYGIVEQARGKIAVDSAPGRGTTFTVYLPACDEDASSAAAGQPEARHAVGLGRTILVVEDEDAVRRATRRMLERRGFNVVDAASGVEAMRQLGGHQPAVDLVLSDVVMPGFQGTELMEVIRERHPGLPVVLMSGYTDRQGQVGVRILAKPFTEEALLARIGEELAARAPARAHERRLPPRPVAAA